MGFLVDTSDMTQHVAAPLECSVAVSAEGFVGVFLCGFLKFAVDFCGCV